MLRPIHGARLCLIALLATAPVSGSAITLSVPGDHPTIQAAVNAAASGDVVKVGSGTYNETVVVGDLREKSVHEVLVGEDFARARRQVYGLEEAPENFLCNNCKFALKR